MFKRLLLSTVFAVSTLSATATSYSDVVSVKDLKNLCQNFDAQTNKIAHIKCYKYIKGVVQGLLLVSDQSSPDKSTESFAQRAMKVRLGDRFEDNKIDAQFCIDKPYNWTEITGDIAKSIDDNFASDNQKSAASSVYAILKAKFPC